jgi:phage terminase Nu1 subunit (DNA packaging protein)
MAMLPKLYTVSGLAVELGMDRRTIAAKLRDVRADGEVHGHPAWRIRTAAIAVLGTGDRPDLSAARAKLASTQEELARLRVERERGLLLPADEVEGAWQSAIGRSRALLLGIPPASADRILLEARKHKDDDAATRAIRDLLTVAIDAALNELSTLDFDADEEDEPAS